MVAAKVSGGDGYLSSSVIIAILGFIISGAHKLCSDGSVTCGEEVDVESVAFMFPATHAFLCHTLRSQHSTSHIINCQLKRYSLVRDHSKFF